MADLVKINASDYGIEENKALQISEMFKPMLDKMVELENEYNKIVVQEITKEVCDQASALRKKYVKVRTGTAAIHKELKDFYLKGGRFVDGWKNAQLMASQGVEDKLLSIEQYYENLEKERVAKLQEERSAILSQYEPLTLPNDLGSMDDEVWDNYIAGIALNYQNKKEAERKAEEDRIARELAEAEAREQQRIENEKLKAQLEAERKATEEKLRLERLEAEKILQAEKDKAKIESDRLEAERKKLADEIKAKELEEQNKRLEYERNKQQAEAAPDKVKLLELSKALLQYNLPNLQSEKGAVILGSVKELLQKISKYIDSKIETM